MSNRFKRDSAENNNNKKDLSHLTPLEYRVTQEKQTERPFSNKYNRHWESGTYHCCVCNAELFASSTKFESKSGWPAFSNVVDPKKVKLKADLSHAKPDLARTEVTCANCNAHLGHLFKDGPKPTGLRYCINSASLNFVPLNASDAQHLGEYNGNENYAAPTEFPCAPENTCGLSSSICVKNADNHSEKLPLPPMATLCLNNQQCKTVKLKKTELSHSSEAIDKHFPKANTPTNKNNNGDDGMKVSPDFESRAEVVFKKCTAYKPSFVSNAELSGPNKFSRSLSQRYPTSKGASLTAARIQFFQNLQQPECATQYNRLANSHSSGSLKLDKEIITKAPLPVKETAL